MAANYRCRQRGAALREVIVLVVTLALVALAARLGSWQLDRAAQKETLQATLEARATAPLVPLGELARSASAAASQSYRRTRVEGRWLGERTVFLDNRQMAGKVGFFVVTPLVLDGTREALLVERGWIARNFADRTVLPPVASPAGTVAIEGTLAPTLSRLYEFAGAASGPIRQNLDLDVAALDLRRETGLTLLPIVLVERRDANRNGDGDGNLSDDGRGGGGGDASGLRRDWPAPASDVQKHYGYAFQWFALGSVLLVLYVWHRIVRPRRHRRT